jgi:hypothetical protein
MSLPMEEYEILDKNPITDLLISKQLEGENWKVTLIWIKKKDEIALSRLTRGYHESHVQVYMDIQIRDKEVRVPIGVLKTSKDKTGILLCIAYWNLGSTILDRRFMKYSLHIHHVL